MTPGRTCLLVRRAPALVIALLACGPASPPTERVHLRLRGEHFGLPSPAPRGPWAVIARELRPVVAGVESIPVLEASEVSLDAGEVELPIAIPDRARGLPASSFSVSVLEIEAEDTGFRERWEELAGKSWVRLDEGHRLSMDERGGAVLRLRPGAFDGHALVRVSAEHLPPRRLESRSFEVPPQTTLVLGYGVIDGERAAPGSSTAFSASLACGDADFAVVHRERLEHVAAGGGWRAARVALPTPSAVCRLRLETSASGDDSAAAVWAVPRVVGPEGDAAAPRRNLILISLDTLRADRLSGYGYSRATSPVIDRELIARGARFVDLSTTYPRTNVAHAGLFTGLYPAAFGDDPHRLALSSPIRSMTEHLAEAGLETVAFTEGALMSRRQGFWFGFDRFSEHAGQGRARETFAEGLRYLDRVGERRFFLFLHTYQTHSPYRPAPEYASLYDADDATGPHARVPAAHRAASTSYDREIRETDALLGEVLGRIDALGLWESTYVAVISDHGEAFSEHRFGGHGRTSFQEELHVPLVIRGPGIPAGHLVEEPASLVDVAPTLLDLVGASPLEHAQGESLSQAVVGGVAAPARPLFFEWMGAGRPRGVRDGRYKVIQRNRGSPHLIVFDLENDPGERRPILDPNPAAERGRELLARYAAEGAALADALAPAADEPPPAPVDRRIVDDLRALGYLE